MRSGDDVAWISVTEMHRRIHAKRGNALLVSEDDWRAIQETLYLSSIPGMRESILEGMAAPESALSESPGW